MTQKKWSLRKSAHKLPAPLQSDVSIYVFVFLVSEENSEALKLPAIFVAQII